MLCGENAGEKVAAAGAPEAAVPVAAGLRIVSKKRIRNTGDKGRTREKTSLSKPVGVGYNNFTL